MSANVRIIPGSDPFLLRRKHQPEKARILFDPPNQERVIVIYWRGAKCGFFDAMVEDIDKNNSLLHKFPIRHEYVSGQRKPLPADTPLPKEWLDEHDEHVEIRAYPGGRILYDLQYTPRLLCLNSDAV